MLIKGEESFLEKEWIEVVDSNAHIVSLHEYYNKGVRVYDSAVLKIEGVVYGILNWDWEKGKIDVDVKERYLPQAYEALFSIARHLGGEFYYNSKEIFDPQKHLPIPSIQVNREKKYFESHDLNNIRWMAFREGDKSALFKALNLRETKEFFLKEGVDRDDIVVTPSVFGWTFILGDGLPSLLIRGDESSSEKALNNLCKSLKKLSKRFIEAQYFEHQGKSNITGYFRANNGRLNFGHWESETESYRKGRVPKELEKLHPSSAHEVASIWSIDPLDFIYIWPMKEEKSSVVVSL